MHETHQPGNWTMEEDILLFQGYSPVALKFASVCCAVFILVGFPGNLITIAALFRCKKVRNATAVFIINLSASDLLFCCFNLPLASTLFWHRKWKWGRLLCRLYPLLRYGLLAVSLFTILAITINRFIMISHPNIYPKLYRPRYLALMVLSTWVFSFGTLVPTWYGRWGKFGLDIQIGSCTILPDAAGYSPKEFLFIVAFVIPCVSIGACYARIFTIVRATARKSHANSRNNTVSTMITAAAVTVSPDYANTHVVVRPRISTTDDSAIGSSSGDNQAEKEEIPCPHLLSPPPFPSPPVKIPTDTNEEDFSRSASPTPSAGSRKASIFRKVRLKEAAEADPVRKSSVCWNQLMLRRNSPADLDPRRNHRRRSTFLQAGKMSAKDKKLLQMILVIFSSFVVCYLPITVSKTLVYFHEYHFLHIVGYLLIYLTTCINPIIYVVMSSEYRQAYKNLLTCKHPKESKRKKMTCIPLIVKRDSKSRNSA